MIAVLVAAVTLPFGMHAEEHTDPGAVTNNVPSKWGYSMSTLLMSEYYGTIFGGIFYNGPMSFTDFVASHQDSAGFLSFDLSVGQKLDRLNRYNADGGNEYDFTVDHTLTLGSKPWQVLADVGVCYLAVYDLGKIKDDVFEEFVLLKFPLLPNAAGNPLVVPYAEAFHYNDCVDGFHNRGWWTYGGLYRDQSLGCKLFGNELKLNVDFRVGASAGAYGSKTGIEYYRIAFALPISKGKWTISPSLILQMPGGPNRSYVHDDESNVFGTLLIKRSF